MVPSTINTAAAALTWLQQNASIATAADVDQILSQLSTTSAANATKALAYSGTGALDVAEHMGRNSDGSIATVGQTEAGKFFA